MHVADRAHSPAPSPQASPQAHSELPPIVHEVLRSPGQPLAPSTRAYMDSRFGHHFGDVRVHADAAAAESARVLDAAAFTVGRDVVFGANRYAPSSRSGRELLGHELAHTIQQRNASGPGPTQQPRGIFETSAAAAGWAVANGQAISLPLPACGVGLSRAPLDASALDAAQEVLAEGKVWREQHYSDALLTETAVHDRAAKLAYSRALLDVDIEMSKAQEAHQEFAPTLDDVTESRITSRRNALSEILRTKSVKRGLSAAEAKAEDPAARQQIRLVGVDMKLVQDEFRSRAFDNAYRMLDESSREIAAMLRTYGALIARAEDVVRFVRVYEGDLADEAAKWVETARIANTSGYSDASKERHRKDLSTTLRRLRALQLEVKRLQIVQPAVHATSHVLGTFASLVPDSPQLKRAKAALAGAWLNAERDHPVLAAYRAGHDDALEDVSLGRGGETEDMRAVVSQATRLLANILTAKLALRQGKVSPFELAPIVALTRAQMLIRRGSVWDVAVEELMRGDDDGEDWAKAAIQIALSALSLFPGMWPVMLASAAIDFYGAGKAYVRYGLDQALVGTSLDRAKALSTKTPSLAGFAWALVGAGLDVVGVKAAYAEAEALSAKVLAGDTEAVTALNRLGESRNVAHLGEDVAKARPAAAESRLAPQPSTHAPISEEPVGAVRAPGGRISPVDRGKGARPFYIRDPKARGKRPGGPGGGGGRPDVPAPSGVARAQELAGTTTSKLTAQSGRIPKPTPQSGEELIARAEAMLERLPAEHNARGELARFIERSQKRLAPIRTQAEADAALGELTERLEKLESRYPEAFGPHKPVAPATATPKGVAATEPHVPRFDERVLVGGLDEYGRATHLTGELHPADLHTGTATGSVYPPGPVRGELKLLRARRGHLLANLFGGRGGDPANLVWLYEFVNNSAYKSELENLIALALRRGENVRFSIVPHFRGRAAAPYAVEVWAESEVGTVVSHRTIPSPGLSDLPLP